MEFLKNQRFEVADFYAGIVANTFHMEVRDDLQACMPKADDLTNLWDEAISELSKGNEEQWRLNFIKAVQSLPEDTGPCAENGKLRNVSRQMNEWWGSFWDQGEIADTILAERKEQHKFDIMKQVMTMRFDWEVGYYYDAGKRFANIWMTLIGEPMWIDFETMIDPMPEEFLDDEPQRYPLADYYAAYLGETHGVDVFEQVQNCLIPDELHMRAWDLAITALSPYDDFAWNKYIETIYMLDNYNYQPCDDFKGLSDILSKEADRHQAFWAQEGAKEILDANAAKYGHDIEATVLVIQDAWDNADAPMAGMAYAHFWKLLLDEPDH